MDRKGSHEEDLENMREIGYISIKINWMCTQMNMIYIADTMADYVAVFVVREPTWQRLWHVLLSVIGPKISN